MCHSETGGEELFQFVSIDWFRLKAAPIVESESHIINMINKGDFQEQISKDFSDILTVSLFPIGPQIEPVSLELSTDISLDLSLDLQLSTILVLVHTNLRRLFKTSILNSSASHGVHLVHPFGSSSRKFISSIPSLTRTRFALIHKFKWNFLLNQFIWHKTLFLPKTHLKISRFQIGFFFEKRNFFKVHSRQSPYQLCGLLVWKKLNCLPLWIIPRFFNN